MQLASILSPSYPHCIQFFLWIHFLCEKFCLLVGNFVCLGKNRCLGSSNGRYSTAAAVEELISPPVQISYTQHLINGHFVDAASGNTNWKVMAIALIAWFVVHRLDSCM